MGSTQEIKIKENHDKMKIEKIWFYNHFFKDRICLLSECESLINFGT